MARAQAAHVLVSNPNLHHPLRLLLLEAGYEVTIFDRAEAALLAGRQHPPRILVTDDAGPDRRDDGARAEVLAQAAADEATLIGLPTSLARLDDAPLLLTLLRAFLVATLPRTSLMVAPPTTPAA
jgi:DNA-binding response OmpR family regulator